MELQRVGHDWAHIHATAAAAKSLQLCLPLCDPIDGSPPGSPIPGILQARTLEWVAISFSNARKWKVKVKSLNRVWLFVTPMGCSLPGSSVYGIFQARVLEWGAMAFSTHIHNVMNIPNVGSKYFFRTSWERNAQWTCIFFAPIKLLKNTVGLIWVKWLFLKQSSI